MSIIATLDVLMRGDTGSLDKSLAKSEGNVKRFAQSTNKEAGSASSALGGMSTKGAASAGAMGGAMGAIAGAVMHVGGVIKDMVVNAIESMTHLGRTAMIMGVTTTELAGLQHQAALTGVGAEALAHSFEHFERTIAKGTQGSAEAAAAFDRLGLDVDALKKMEPAEAWGKFADALKETGDAADKLDLLRAIGGRQMAELLPLIVQGSEGMAAAIKEAAELGPTSQAAVAQVSAVSRSWAQMKEAVFGFGRSLAVILAPAIQTVSDWLGGLTKRFAGAFSPDVIVTIQEVGKAVWEVWLAMQEAINPAIAIVNELGLNLDINLGSWETWKKGILTAVFTVQIFFEKFRDVVKIVVNSMILAIKEFGNAFVEVWNTVTGSELDKFDIDKHIDKIKAAWVDIARPFGDAMDEKFAAFEAKVRALSAPDKAPGKGKPIETFDKGPAAMDVNSKEAFHVLFGQEDYQKKAYWVATQQLQTAIANNKLIQKLIKKGLLFGVAKFRK